jgi:hypothetical protein
MRFLRHACVIVLLGIFGNCAHANWITSWGDGDPADEWSIDQDQGTIIILKGDDNEYKFYSETYQNSGVEGVINNITVAAGATGNFTLLIANEDPSIPGRGGTVESRANLTCAPALEQCL